MTSQKPQIEPSQRRSAAARRDAGADFGATLRPGERAPAVYAASVILSRGRLYAEPECPTRSPFQRDRDRILHATAFRRLTHKTQVFLHHEGDHFRTRLTHSLEVAQVARTIARQLRLDEDLAEALALAHDLGHPPFGHAGERALDQVMRDHGGFDHNAQSVRVVTELERKYRGFDGLNLTWETLEGLAKHNGPVTNEKGRAILKVTRRIETWRSLEPSRWASAEAQVAALSDDIAYLTHDVDDGLRAGLLSLAELADVPFVGAFAAAVMAEGGADDTGRAVFEVTRRMITALIRDVVVESRIQLAGLDPKSPDDIRAADRPTVLFSAPLWADLQALRGFLFERVYRHARVLRVMTAAEGIVRDLFARYADPDDQTALPPAWRLVRDRLDPRGRARLAADYLAGQTDRYAIEEHRRLFAQTPDLR
jgi:dGTPase